MSINRHRLLLLVGPALQTPALRPPWEHRCHQGQCPSPGVQGSKAALITTSHLGPAAAMHRASGRKRRSPEARGVCSPAPFQLVLWPRPERPEVGGVDPAPLEP